MYIRFLENKYKRFSCKNAVVEMIGGLGVHLEKSLEVDTGSELTEEYLQVEADFWSLLLFGGLLWLSLISRVRSTQ